MGGSSTKAVPTTSTTAQSVQLPSWMNNAGEQAVGIASGIANRPYQGYGGSLVADLSPNTQSGIQYAADTAGTGSGAIQSGLDTAGQSAALAKSQVGTGQGALSGANNFFQTAGNTAANNTNTGQPESANYSALAGLAGNAAVNTAGASSPDINAARGYTTASAGPTTGADISRYMNPYVDQALQPAANNINRQASIDKQHTGDLAAMRGSFGGDRQAVLEGEDQRNQYQALTNLYGTGFKDAFENAQGQANAEKGRYASAAGLAQGTGALANTSANDLVSRLTQAGAASGAAGTNASDLANASQNRSLAAGSALQGLAGAQGNAATADTERMLSTVSPQYAGAAAQIQQTQATLNNLVQTGQIDQTQAQNVLDTQLQQFNNERDWATNQLNALIATLSGVPYSTQSNSTTHGQTIVSQPSQLGQIAGGALTAASLFASDIETKEDIRPVDDEAVLKKLTDVPVSTYKYKHLRALEIGDTGEKRIGPMSQDFGRAFSADPDAKVIPMPQAIGVLFSAVRALEKRTAPYSALRDLKEAA